MMESGKLCQTVQPSLYSSWQAERCVMNFFAGNKSRRVTCRAAKFVKCQIRELGCWFKKEKRKRKKQSLSNESKRKKNVEKSRS